MSLLTVGSVAFDALETPFGKTDKIIGGAATYITLSASYFTKENNLVAVVGDDFPQTMIDDLNQHGSIRRDWRFGWERKPSSGRVSTTTT